MFVRWLCKKLGLIDPAQLTISLVTQLGGIYYKQTLGLAILSNTLTCGQPFPIEVNGWYDLTLLLEYNEDG